MNIEKKIIMASLIKLLLLTILLGPKTHAQKTDIERRINSELQMNFPGIYFKHNSTDYAKMPYTIDSAFKWIAKNFDDNINSLVMWRDSIETEALLNKRSQKIKLDLRKYTKSSAYEIYSMGDEQKISSYTLRQSNDSAQKQYLLNLNSVLEVSKTKVNNTIKYSGHIMKPSIFCWGCWKSGFHWRTRMKMKKAIKPKSCK